MLRRARQARPDVPWRLLALSLAILLAVAVWFDSAGPVGEVVATAAAVAAGGADLVDVSLPTRLAGPVARAGRLPVVARIASTDEALAALQRAAAADPSSAEIKAEIAAVHLRRTPPNREEGEKAAKAALARAEWRLAARRATAPAAGRVPPPPLCPTALARRNHEGGTGRKRLLHTDAPSSFP